VVVVTGPGATGPRVLAAVAALQGRAAAAGPIHEPVTATPVGGPGSGPALVPAALALLGDRAWRAPRTRACPVDFQFCLV